MQYCLAKTPGFTYFFTVVTYQRQVLFREPETVDLVGFPASTQPTAISAALYGQWPPT